MSHKGLEILAQRKLCEQNGTTSFFDKELDKTFNISDLTIENSARIGFNHYKDKGECNRIWSEIDYEDVLANIKAVTDHHNGIFSPLKRKILSPEFFFDLEISEPWAWNSIIDPHTGERIEGYLRIKGTIDLVTEDTPNRIEYIDYKTGRRYDWATSEIKDFYKIKQDEQLLLYFYGLTRLFPSYRYIYVTIFFTKDGGPFTIPFDRDYDVPLALEMIKKKFLEIKNCQKPTRIWDNDEKRNSICLRWCAYGKTKDENGNRICGKYYKELQQLGLSKLTKKYSKPGSLSKYSDGGGQSNREV